MRKQVAVSIVSTLGVVLAKSALAVCPVCTVAVGAGLGLARWFGVDDTVTGVWIGALIVSMASWTVNWIKAKRPKWRFPADFWAWLVAYATLVFVPLWFQGIIGHPLNVLWGMDKVLLGSAVGAIAFGATASAYEHLKAKNGGHAHFPFQKVAMPVAALSVLSSVFYVITKR
jgi:hypothetical protein